MKFANWSGFPLQVFRDHSDKLDMQSWKEYNPGLVVLCKGLDQVVLAFSSVSSEGGKTPSQASLAIHIREVLKRIDLILC